MTKAEKDEENGKKALAHNSAVTVVVYGFGEKDIKAVRAILAAKGYFTLNMRDIADMGVTPPDLQKYHPDDWGSNDGKHKKKSEYRITVWIHTSKAARRNLNTTMDPLEAWNQIKGCEDTVKFLGGERAKPGEHRAPRCPDIRTGQSPGGRRWVGTKLPGSILASDIGDYGWTGQQSGSGFCDLAPSILHYNWF